MMYWLYALGYFLVGAIAGSAFRGVIERKASEPRIAWKCPCGSACIVKSWTRRDRVTGLAETFEGYACNNPECRYNPSVVQ